MPLPAFSKAPPVSLAFLLLGAWGVASAQVDFQEAPRKCRLYARDRATDTAQVPIAGKVTRAGADYSEIRVKAFRNGTALAVRSAPLTFANGTASFSLNYPIKAELAQYSFSIYGFGGGKETPILSADSVVAGDVYIIQGQSNAEAHGFDGTSSKADISPFIRVMGSSDPDPAGFDPTWRVGQGDGDYRTDGNTGQWGLRFARHLVDAQRIPVAIFNGNHTGKAIAFFSRNASRPDDAATNYGRLLRRVRNGNLQDKVRAIFWVQGEADFEMPKADYMTAFRSLRQAWKQDYAGTEKIYIFQMRNGCTHPLETKANILEAQRLLGTEAPDMGLMSMTALTHDRLRGTFCHYVFPGGYALMGDHIHRMVARDLYGVADAGDVEPAAIRFAELTGPKELTLRFSPLLDSLRWRATAEKDFKIYGASATVASASVRGMTVRLTLSATPDGIKSISFLGQGGELPEAMALNRNGVGALLFHQFPITSPAFRDSVAVSDVLRANGLTLSVEKVATRSGSGRVIGLKLPGLGLTVLPPEIGFLDSLRSLDVSENLLSALPREIVLLGLEGGAKVDGNRLCAIPAAHSDWLGRSAGSGWQAAQTRDGVRDCNGVVGIGHTGRADRRLAMTWLGGRGIIRFRHPGTLRNVRVLDWQGRQVADLGSVTPAAEKLLPRLRPGLYVVSAQSPAGTVAGGFLVFPYAP
jgi:hypothetical protein